MNAPDLVSVSEAARLLQISAATLDRIIADGRLRPIQLRERGTRRFHRADVLALLEHDRSTGQ